MTEAEGSVPRDGGTLLELALLLLDAADRSVSSLARDVGIVGRKCAWASSNDRLLIRGVPEAGVEFRWARLSREWLGRFEDTSRIARA